jgi:hypothetical protein
MLDDNDDDDDDGLRSAKAKPQQRSRDDMRVLF